MLAKSISVAGDIWYGFGADGTVFRILMCITTPERFHGMSLCLYGEGDEGTYARECFSLLEGMQYWYRLEDIPEIYLSKFRCQQENKK